MSFWMTVGEQLRRPNGGAGRTAGRIMRFVNARPNTLAVAALEVRPADHVLELGCGPGHALQLMANQIGDGVIHALDPSETMLAQARRRNRAAVKSARVRLYCAAAELIPLGSNSVNKVLAVNVAYFWSDPSAALREIFRVLRPGGRVSIYVTDAATMRRWRFADGHTHRTYDGQQLADALRHGGFRHYSIAIQGVSIARRVTGLIGIASK